jgi:predicted transcriptional regulator
MSEALHLIQARVVAQLPVVEPESRVPLGMVTRRGILKLIDARTKLGA